MEESHEGGQMHCLNCGSAAEGEYCGECGQRLRDNSDRSLSKLLGDFLGNLFFIDNRFVRSVAYLIGYPGRMTVEFLEGKRKKFIAPVTLFLFFNLIYFLVNPLSDYSLSLEDQMYSQPFSPWAKEQVDVKLKSEDLDLADYAVTYQNMSDKIAKTIMIINVPLIALVISLMGFKRRPYYFDHLIFALHFFSVFMLCWVLTYFVGVGLSALQVPRDSMLAEISFNLFAVFIPLLYAIVGMKRFLQLRWYWSIPAGVGVLAGVVFASLCYRFVIFSLTFWVA